MEEDACRDSSGGQPEKLRLTLLAGYLSQLSNFCKKSLLAKSGVYSCLAFFSFGLMSVLPASSHLRPGISDSGVQPASTPTAEQVISERCRLQADVALFLSLQEQKNGISQSEVVVPCEKQISIKTTRKFEKPSDEALDNTIQEMTAGYPVARMAPAIAKYDRDVAALIVGIAKKESDWGKHVPLDKNGDDCFNYWGYKGAGTRGVAMGHGCFGSPEEAVKAVGDRLTKLVALRQTSEPKNMIIWKCGSSCATHTPDSVRKWISDVDLYYRQIAVK